MVSTGKVSSHGPLAYSRSAGFQEWIYEHNLLDLGYVGSSFTWVRGLTNDNFSGARLDRTLSTVEW